MDSPDSTFEQIESLIAKGAVFCGNHWVSDSKGGHYEIRLSHNGGVETFKSERSFVWIPKSDAWLQLGLPF